MTLTQIDTQIAKWKQVQSNIALKLVDLDEMPTYQCIRRSIYRGTTAVAIGELGDGIHLMWTLSALCEDVFTKLTSARAHSPMPWEKEKWLLGLDAMLLQPVIAVPGQLDLSDTLKQPTLTLGQALTEVVNQYQRLLEVIHRIDAQIAQTNAKVEELSQLADGLGAGNLRSQITAIADQVQSDPLGVSLDSFAAIESQLRRFRLEVSDRQGVVDALDRGEKTLTVIEKLRVSAQSRISECDRILGFHQSIPSADFTDLKLWGHTLRSRLTDSEVGSIKVGLSKWLAAIEEALKHTQEVDRANQDALNRYQEISGRFSAAQAKAISTHRQNPKVEQLAGNIRDKLAEIPKDLASLETSLVMYEQLLRG